MADTVACRVFYSKRWYGWVATFNFYELFFINDIRVWAPTKSGIKQRVQDEMNALDNTNTIEYTEVWDSRYV